MSSARGGLLAEGGDALSRAVFIAGQKASYRVVSCRAPGVSESWFRKWHGRHLDDFLAAAGTGR
jgi:hypothetical protein